MKVLISTDIEGVAGVYHAEQVRAGNPEFERARLLMAREANAAIEGAFDAGATQVLVNDSHGGFRNMPPDVLDPRAQVIQGKPRYLSMVAGVELGVDAVCMIGYHSMARGRGILAHTINSFAFAGIWLNDRELGEAGLYGALAGEYGVKDRPFVLSGPQRVTLRTQSPAMADLFCQWPQFERIDGVTLAFAAETVEGAVRMLNCCSAMSSMLR